MDISNAIPENSPITVIGTDFSEIKNSEVIVISASTGTYVKSRTEMLPEQATMIRDIAKKIKKFAPDSKIIMVSNPVDILNYIFSKGNWLFQRMCYWGFFKSRFKQIQIFACKGISDKTI